MEPEEKHPASEILLDPLNEETRKNRRALLAIASICLAVRFTGSLPRQITALGITFSGTDQQRLIYLALVLQIYFCATFILSALADFVRWKRAIRRKTSTYVERNLEYSVSDATHAAVDILEKWHFRLEAPEQRMKTELQGYAQGKDSLPHFAYMVWQIFPGIFLHLVLILLFPILVFVVSFVSLLVWLPSVRG